MIRWLSGSLAVTVSFAVAACADITVESSQSCVEAPVTFTLPTAPATAGGATAPAAPSGAGSATLTGTTPLDLGVLAQIRSAGSLDLKFVDGTFTLPADQSRSLVHLALSVSPTDATSGLPPIQVMNYAVSDAAKQAGAIDLAAVMDTAPLMRYLAAGNVTLNYAVTLQDAGATKLAATSRMCVQATSRIEKSAF
jgi:hypothetical protein